MEIKELEIMLLEAEKNSEKKEDYEDKVLEYIDGKELNDEEIDLILKSINVDQGYIISEYINKVDKEQRNVVFDKIVANDVFKDKNTGVGVKFCLSLLAYASINNWGEDVWKRFIIKVVSFSRIKEDDSIKYIDGIEEWVKVYFIDILWEEVNNLPSLTRINDSYVKTSPKNEVIVPLFIRLMKQSLDACKNDKELFEKRVKLTQWINSFRPKSNASNETDLPKNVEAKEKVELKKELVSETTMSIENTSSVENISTDKDITVKPSVNNVKEETKKETKDKKATSISMKDKSEQFKKIIDIALSFEKLEEDNKKLKTKNKDLEEKRKESSKEKNELQIELNKWIQQCGEKQNNINELKAEIEHRNEVIDIVKADKSESDQEYKNALGAALKSSYVDFCELKEMPMSVEVGDAIADTLDNVFKILEKNGITIRK